MTRQHCRKRGTCRLSSVAVRAAALFGCCIFLSFGGCSKDKEQAVAGPAQQMVESLKKAGLETEGFEQAAAIPYAAQQCQQGKVEQLDLLICAYLDEASAKAAEAKLQQFIGTAVTGLIRQRGPVAVVIADRDKQDLQGKAINKVSQVVQGG